MPDLGKLFYELRCTQAAVTAMNSELVYFAKPWNELSEQTKEAWRRTADAFARYLN